MPVAPASPSNNPLIRRLDNYARLSAEDRAAVQRLCAEKVQRFAAKDDVIREGEEPRVIRLVVDGWACRYKHLEDGRRQVVGLFLPGDLCDLNVFVLREMDHFVGAITALTLAQITRDAFEEATLAHPRLLQSLWWDSLVTMAIQREWLLNLGSRTAFERITHLLCEIFLRLRAAGRARGQSCEFPLTQAIIADIAGLSTVHVSRTFQAIRDERLVEIRNRVMTIPDIDALMAASLFNPNYLHLSHEGRHLDANDAPGDVAPTV
ncbi:Crp/Fnr family transcriptional regulator [Rubellimicrobium aerolatum]|uniref:Crp/Fnr family transcriptional regulator n=1 Tax=Rubellimicrobium aerolatum TaxID=490979 RepID=A0ABW0S9D9_9RHOB|nr:Crp/Fnr family transcriptional regulator [Rubellimicrobium aerolatum]MBP1804894.1 CRP-like cAMP-binding protein [Rubellimicrobium aerolatum]